MSGSGWGLGWFGGAAAKKKDVPKNAILTLRSQLEMLSKREKHLQHQIDEQDGIARKNVATNKRIAKEALRRKKLFENSHEQTAAQIITLEREIYSIESANINKETLDALKSASAAMKQIHGGMNIDQVDQIMEELQDQKAIGKEINDVITQQIGDTGVEEDELDEELAELQQEVLDENLLNTGTVPVSDRVHQLPSAAKTELKNTRVEEDDEEEELRKLQQEMAM